MNHATPEMKMRFTGRLRYSHSGSDYEAFIWDAVHGMRSLRDVLVSDFGLDLSGWTLRYAEGISDDGMTIIGHGNNPDGNTEAWMAVIPEPATLSLLAFACPIILCRKRRRER